MINEQRLVSEHEYDRQHEPLDQAEYQWKRNEYTYDGNSNVKTVADINGNTFQMDYDQRTEPFLNKWIENSEKKQSKS